jgi:hypothetical protein
MARTITKAIIKTLMFFLLEKKEAKFSNIIYK